MLTDKIEDAFHNRKITKLVLDDSKSMYGIFTGRINVVSSVTSNTVSYKYRYYFKEIDIVEYRSRQDLYKAMKKIVIIMQDQIADVEEFINTGFSGKKFYV